MHEEKCVLCEIGTAREMVDEDGDPGMKCDTCHEIYYTDAQAEAYFAKHQPAN